MFSEDKYEAENNFPLSQTHLAITSSDTSKYTISYANGCSLTRNKAANLRHQHIHANLRINKVDNEIPQDNAQ